MIPTAFHIRLLMRAFLYGAGLLVVVILLLMINATMWFPGDAEFPSDCALVFGAAVHGKAEPGPGIWRRVSEAAHLYSQKNVERLYLSGGKGSETQESEAHVMRKVALMNGVDPEDVYIEEESRSTFENLTNVSPMMADCNSIVAISDRYHLARIKLISSTVGINNLKVHPASIHAPFAFEFMSLAREAFANIYFRGLQVGLKF